MSIRIEHEGPIALVTLDRSEALNALNRATLEELDRAFGALEHQDGLRAVIITGAGKAFVAGADIREMADFGHEASEAFAHFGQSVFNRIAAFPRPVIAALNGFALGGGLELAMACDFRIASEKAKLGQPEVNLGVIPGFGGTQRLPRLVGPARGKYLLLTGATIDAAQALAWGLVEEVVAPEALLDRCRELANTLAAKGPLALSRCKEAVDRGMDLTLPLALELETRLFSRSFSTQDQKEGMKAFLEKRPAAFLGK